MTNEILLEAGTNEMELLLFCIGETTYGVNIAKVREIISAVETIAIPCAPHAVEGSFRLRGEVLTLIGLGKYLRVPPRKDDKSQKLIIVIELNNRRCGILVDSVDRIHRTSWDRIEPPPALLIQSGTPIVAVARVAERIVLILDFETIIGELLGEGGVGPGVAPQGVDMKESHLLVVDDSPTIRQVIENILKISGYTNLTVCSDGQQAWEALQASLSPESEPFDLLLTDIEMPRMDGLHLTKRVKSDPRLSHIPVVLFSSLIRADTANKGNAVGANAQITKLEEAELIRTIDKLLKK